MADTTDVLVVGAGPTGLALAARLAEFGVSVRLVDAKEHPVPESRALALQPRTLEVLRGAVSRELVHRGNPAVRLRWHVGRRTGSLAMFDLGMEDTAYPHLLFLSQAETEEVLVEHLRRLGVEVGWRSRLVGFAQQPPPPSADGSPRVMCSVVDADGTRTTVHTRYLVGCDGAHSSVRDLAGIRFDGGRYPQTFLLADTEADGLDPEAAHVWLGGGGPLLFFPLRRPASWRVLTARRTASPSGTVPEEMRSVVDAVTDKEVRLGTPVWSTAFEIHHRHAATYRDGLVFLAGDAAHIHSPAGAQGMNTGIQDAVNLAWKLALVCRGRAVPQLLDTYDRERRPVGAWVVRFTDRVFTVATSEAALPRLVRTHLAPRVLGSAERIPAWRARVFRTVSQLDIGYQDTLASRGGVPPRTRRPGRVRGWNRVLRRHTGPRPGDRLPDTVVVAGDGSRSWLHDALTEPAFHLLLCGRPEAWDDRDLVRLSTRYADLLRVVTVGSRDVDAGPAVPGRPEPSGGRPVDLADPDGRALGRLGVRRHAQLLVRPDGHVGYRADSTDLAGVAAFLAYWLC